MTENEFISNLKSYGVVHKKQEEFIRTIVDDIYNNFDKSKISVVPSRCGIGKSTAINSILYRLVNNWIGSGQKPSTGYGAILITDTIDRLEKTYNYKDMKEYAYLMKFDSEKTEYENQNYFQEQIREQFKYPIILLTTQKYFKMTPKEREILYKWGNGGTRELCLIDEKPYITKTVEIDERYLSDISVSLENIKKCEDKTFIGQTWKAIYDELYNIRERISKKYDTMWLKKSRKTLLLSEEEDIEFFNKLSSYVTSQTYENIVRIRDIYANGCLFISRNSYDVDNSRKFILTYNNMEKFDVNKTKYYIFDATAKFDIDYTIDKDLIEYLDIDDKKSVKDIQVNIIPFSTSQKNLKKSGKYSSLSTICRWINANFEDVLVECNRGSNGIIYNRIKKELKTTNIEYFGNIKGKNDYESLNEVVHIGFNRFSDIVYLESYIIHKNKAEEWNSMSNDDIKNDVENLLEVENGVFKTFFMKLIFMSKCVVDTVQNIMRIKCRHFSNEEKCIIWIITSNYYKDIVRRVADNIGANYDEALPKEFEDAIVMNRKPANDREMTNPQKVMKYLNSVEKGTVIKTKDIYDNTGLSAKELNKTKKNKIVADWFNTNTVKKGTYKIS